MHFSCIIVDNKGAIIMKSNKTILAIYYGLLAFILSLLIKASVDCIFNLLKKIFDIIAEDTISTIISGILCVCFIFFVIIKRHLSKRNNKINNKYYWIQFVTGLTLLLLSYNLVYHNTIGLIELGYGPFTFFENYVNNLTITSLSLLNTCILVPIIEEFIYRVFIFKKLQHIYPSKKCIIVSALIFGVIHLNYSQTINAFFIGLILGWIYYYTHSFFLVAFLHILNNTYFVVSDLYPSMIYTIKEGFDIAELFIGLLIGIIAILLIRTFMKNNPVRYEEDVIEEQMKLQSNEAFVD
jgi:membrane protease YdiL (CAAX protease family)